MNHPPSNNGAPSASQWQLPPPFGMRTYLLTAVALVLLLWSGRHVEMDRMVVDSAGAAAYAVGLKESSSVAEGFATLLSEMFPPTFAMETPIDRIPDFDPDALPLFSHLETRRQMDVRIDYDTLEQDILIDEQTLLIEPIGYLWLVIRKMGETLEIGLWGTLIAVLLSLPLAFFCAANYAPHRTLYHLARATVSFFRTIPELVSALLLVLAFGFGPVAGILALGLHCTGFLGKFYAEDIENADRGAQDALRALGAGRLRVLRLAVLPQVLPQYIAYTLYILDRNVRMAAVIGIVGAGGIGQELKGRYDLFQYSHVATILIVLFVTVLLLDSLSARIRARIIR
jgi:phosphonate transport system permease protein